MKTIAIIGLGNRGGIYADGFAESGRVEIAAVCDPRPESLRQGREKYGVKESMLFADEEAFFAERRADALVVATLDELHRRQTARALRLGYDVLLEKPVAPTYDGCLEIAQCAARTGRSVVVCHNLRYAPFYLKIKELAESGAIGPVVSVEQSENVGFGHYMCSFVRGKWRSERETSPIVLQKCCHDLDLICWLIGKPCEKLSSAGGLSYYTAARADGAPAYCVDCDRDCRYDARSFYLQSPESLCVPYGFDTGPDNIKRYVADKSHDYGRCVFRSDNDVADRQTVTMLFEGGVTASLLLHGFANQTDRLTAIYGESGTVRGAFGSGVVTLEKPGRPAVSFDVNAEAGGSHNGGDGRLVRDYIEYITGGKRSPGISLVGESIYGHKLAFAAERSRKNGGEWVYPGGGI